MAEWHRRGEDRPVFQGFLRIVERDFVSADGRAVTWEMLDLPRTVAVLALTPSGDLVMVEQFRPGPERTVLSLAGGFVDEGETVEEGAARELREETGYAAGSLEVVASHRTATWTSDRFVAIARDCVPAYEQDLDPMEDCVPVVRTVDHVRAELRAGRMIGTDQAYLAFDHAGLL